MTNRPTSTRRIEDALASIFLPHDSVYQHLDDAQDGEDFEATSGGDPTAETGVDPFDVGNDIDEGDVAPSVAAASDAREDAPHSALDDSAAAMSNKAAAASFSPFHDPEDESTLSVTTAHRSSSAPEGFGSNASGSDAGVGHKSLMGLLGGTRYDDPTAFEDSARSEQHERAGGASGFGAELRRDPARGLTLSESRSLAATLPPPPSSIALSPPASSRVRSSYSDEEDELQDHDEDGPPDFTQRVPLVAPSRSSAGSSTSPTQRRRRRRNNPDADAADSWLPRHRTSRSRQPGMSPRDRALWRWINVEDLDGFLQACYVYYVGKGIWCIALGRGLNLLTAGWVIAFSTFLGGCIDYGRLWNSHRLGDVVVDRCVSRFSGLTLLLVMLFGAFYAYNLVRFGVGVKQLWHMHDFYAHLLEVPENDIQTIPWHAIVSRLAELRASHPSALSSRSTTASTTAATANARTLDAHDVANRIMREENYLIALFNKDVLDLSVPVPNVLHRWAPRLSARLEASKGDLTRTMEWNLSFCLVGFLFGTDGQVRRAFLSERNRGELVEALRRRFMLMAVINAVFAPFIVLYLLMYSFFRYFEEYHKNPSSIGSRQFTQLARWKFREFNELPHLFQQRLNRAHPIADQYVNQFPKEKTALVSRFIAFLAGSFAAVLILFSLIDPDAFLHFEITPGRTVLFYIGIFGTVLAFARGMVPDENRVVDAEQLMRDIVDQTHYLPVEWSGKLHSAEVHTAFGQLFQMKIALFVQEILSVIVTPFVLWYTLPQCSEPIVDFFREFSVHVDGLGYVCSFAVFDFKRHGDIRFGAPVQVQEERWKSGEGKMEKSFLTFAHANPSWVPRDQAQSLFLSRMTDTSGHPQQPPQSHTAHPPRHPGLSTSLHPRFAGVPSGPHARSSSRSARFAGASALVEEEVPPAPASASSRFIDQSAGRHPTHRQSRVGTMYNSAPGSGPRSPPSALRSPAATRANVGPGRTFSPGSVFMEEPPIEEESRLDGEVFVAPTQGMPFGAESGLGGALEDEPAGGGEDVRVRDGERGPQQKLGGMLGELYNLQGKRW